MSRKLSYTLFAGILLIANACNPSPLPSAMPTAAITYPPVPSATPTQTILPSQTPSPTSTPTPTATLTLTPSATWTPSTTPIPTYVKLRGEVNVEHAVCHYGPGQPYLYKYGVVGGSNLEIIARLEGGLDTYLEVQAIGGNNPCWVNAKWMNVKGNLLDVRPVHAEDVDLPMTPYYAPPKWVSAKRSGNDVIINWDAFPLNAGDDSEQYPYLVEAWVCREGMLVFIPTGTYQLSITIEDQPGCSQPSYGRYYAVEKHGYTRWLKIPWPAAG